MARREYIPVKRERSVNKVIIALKNGSKRFTDLEDVTGLSPAGLNETLKMMKDRRTVEKIIVDKKQMYRLTGKGEEYNPSLSYDLSPIHQRSGSVYRDYSHLRGETMFYDCSWGIESVMTIDKDIEKMKLLEPKDVVEIEELIYKKMKNNLKENEKSNVIDNGKMVLGFSMDYNEIRKSIEQKSLEHIENMSKEEAELIMKRDDDPEGFTDEESEELIRLQKETVKKIKKL